MGWRGKYKNRKDSNQTEIVEGLREAGFTVYVQDRPCDLLVGKPDQPTDPIFVDTKTMDGKPTKAQEAFNKLFPGCIKYWRTLTECLIGLGKYTPMFNYRVYSYDQLVCVELTQIADHDIPGVLSLIKEQKGFGYSTGAASGSFEVWPKKGCKVDLLAKRIDKALDRRRIEVV